MRISSLLCRGSCQWSKASSDGRVAEGSVGGRAESSRHDHFGASQDGAHGRWSQAPGCRGCTSCYQSAGGFKRGKGFAGQVSPVAATRGVSELALVWRRLLVWQGSSVPAVNWLRSCFGCGFQACAELQIFLTRLQSGPKIGSELELCSHLLAAVQGYIECARFCSNLDFQLLYFKALQTTLWNREQNCFVENISHWNLI